ncbi:MAG: alpha/beta fold hydrolase [Burkholderiaceae bacterium]|nr:alpha/beta fold hydrolase [Burkholderiaceae bacterium]
MDQPGTLVELRPGRPLRVHLLPPTGDPPGGRQGEQRTLFLVHGAGGRAAQWRRVVPALRAAGWRVVAADTLGHGDSPAPREADAYDGRELVEDLRALLARYASQRNRIVAHSYGTLLTLGALAGGAQPPLERLLLLGPPAPNALRKLPWFIHLPVPLLERLRPRLSAGFRMLAWGPDADPDLVDEETRISDRNPLHVFKAQTLRRLQLGPDELARVAALGLPVQVLAGDRDGLTPADGARRLADALPGAELQVLERTGHQILLERPEAVVAAALA